MSIDEIIKQAQALPLDERIAIIDRLLLTLSNPDPEIEAEWLEVAARRADELTSGAVQPVAGEVVLERPRQHICG